MKVYRSKIDAWFAIPLTVLLAAILVIAVWQGEWFVGLFLLLVIAFILQMLFTTYYTITDDNILKIRCGFLYKKDFPVSTIRKIEKNYLALSSPAASFDRLELFYGKYDSVLVSPKQKAEFIADLLEINPDITLDLKKGKTRA